MGFKDIYYNYKPFNLNIAITDDAPIDAVVAEIFPKIVGDKITGTDRNRHYLKVLILIL